MCSYYYCCTLYSTALMVREDWFAYAPNTHWNSIFFGAGICCYDSHRSLCGRAAHAERLGPFPLGLFATYPAVNTL